MWKEILEAYEILDDPGVTGEKVARLVKNRGPVEVQVIPLEEAQGSTQVVRVLVPGMEGAPTRGPTLGILGTLGGVGARPDRAGFVSDGDGALVAVACALKAASMARKGDRLWGDLMVTTHICPHAPTRPHHPVPFMMSPVSLPKLMDHLVAPEMSALLSVDATKGNRVVNHRGFAISPTVRQGWILRVSEDLMDIQEAVTGQSPRVLPITTQDITPYGNGVFHLNSIMQPSTVTWAPVVGVAVTAQVPVAGTATGASRLVDLEETARFCLEVAKSYGRGECSFFDAEEFDLLVRTYGALDHLQKRETREV